VRPVLLGELALVAFVDPLLQLLAHLEEGQALGLNPHGRARARVAAFVGLVVADLGAPGTAGLGPVAPPARAPHAIEDSVDDELRLTAGELELGRDRVDQIALGHASVVFARARHLTSPSTSPQR